MSVLLDLIDIDAIITGYSRQQLDAPRQQAEVESIFNSHSFISILGSFQRLCEPGADNLVRKLQIFRAILNHPHLTQGAVLRGDSSSEAKKDGKRAAIHNIESYTSSFCARGICTDDSACVQAFVDCANFIKVGTPPFPIHFKKKVYSSQSPLPHSSMLLYYCEDAATIFYHSSPSAPPYRILL